MKVWLSQKITLLREPSFLLYLESEENPKIREAVNASQKALDSLSVIHFPIAFPEVFLRGRPGFDVILGNPPWEKVKVEEHAFWARHFPGLRGRSEREQESERLALNTARPNLVILYEGEIKEKTHLRQAIVSGDYPGIGSGDPDLYKAFCWRFWRLSSKDGGYLGVVLPRNAASGKGSSDFRQILFNESERVDLTTLTNRAGWIFENIHQQYNIILLCAKHGQSKANSITLRGPFTSLSSLNDALSKTDPSTFSYQEISRWNDTLTIPLLPNSDSVEVFAQLRKSPRLDLKLDGQWRAGPDTKLHATNQKPLMDLESLECPEGYWPVYKGESFDLWNPDTGIYYAWANPEPVLDYLHQKRWRSGNNHRSVHSEFSQEYRSKQLTLPSYRARMAFRDVSNSIDRRTVITCLIPPKVFIAHMAPYFLWPSGDEKDHAYLLGVLSSIPLDWYARRFVVLHLTYFIINPFPIPRPSRNNPLWKRFVILSGRLACPDQRFAKWAGKVGVTLAP